jgi:hypothetical protein
MTHHRPIIVVCLIVLMVSAPSLVQAAAASSGRLQAGGAPPTPYGRWLEAQRPDEPFSAKTLYTTPAADEAVAPAGQAGAEATSSGSRRYLILVKNTLYASIATKLTTYISDVEGEGLTVELIQISGGTAEALRNLFISKRAEPAGLEGCYMIGNLPIPWFVNPNDYGDGSPATFPCELYLMDMDGAWTDTDADGKPDLHTSGSGDEGPEIYCGRTIAHNLTLESGKNEASLINRYLDKVHDFRQGLITSNVTACLYTDDDWAYWHSQYYTDAGNAWSSREEYYSGSQTTAADYKVKLQTPYEHMRLGCHSWSGGHTFKIGADWTGGSVYSSDIVNNPPNVLYYNLYACSNARWTDSNCMGVWYTMNSGPGLGAVGSSKTGGMNDNAPFYTPIGWFYPNGYAVQNWFDSFDPYNNDERSWTFGMLWLGDPTLWRTRVAPSSFWLESPSSGAQFSQPDLWLSWQTSEPAGVYETVTYTLIVDNNEDFCSPELVVDGLVAPDYHITAADGLTGVYQYWRVIATTNFGKTRTSSNAGSFTIALDGDLDGMADSWEDANGLDPDDPSDALHDADGDGLLNREEQDINTDPHSAASPAFIYVDDDNAGDPAQDGSAAHPYSSIQTAIDAATPPAVVKVLPGTYTELVTMANHVWVLGSGAAQTTIQMPSTLPVVLFSDIEDGLLADVTVTSAGANVLVRMFDSSFTVRDCVLAGGRNGLSVNDTGSLKLLNCLVADNTTNCMWAGGTVIVDIANCTIVNNAACGARITYYNTVRIENSIFYGNSDDLEISNKATVTALYSDIGDGDFPGSCISADPLFVGGPGSGYYLSQTAAGQALDSPCVDTGNPTTMTNADRLTTRTDGVRDTGVIDMGYHVPYALRISSISASSPVTLEWNAQPGLEYVVEWSTDRETWSDVDVGQTSSWIDTDTAGYAKKYYRVREK